MSFPSRGRPWELTISCRRFTTKSTTPSLHLRRGFPFCTFKCPTSAISLSRIWLHPLPPPLKFRLKGPPIGIQGPPQILSFGELYPYCLKLLPCCQGRWFLDPTVFSICMMFCSKSSRSDDLSRFNYFPGSCSAPLEISSRL